MYRKLALAIAFALAAAGAASAEGQGHKPDAAVPASPHQDKVIKGGDKGKMRTGAPAETTGDIPATKHQTEVLDFEVLDADGDGVISQEDVADDEELSAGWADMDQNQDGEVNEEEFSQFEEMQGQDAIEGETGAGVEGSTDDMESGSTSQ